MLFFDDGSRFAEGATSMRMASVGRDRASLRILVPIIVEGVQTEAVLDTGGVYLVCDPDLADALDLDPTGGVGRVRLLIRGEEWEGSLYRLSLMFPAVVGEGVQVEATAFVPRCRPGEPWPLGTIAGLTGCLERLRFAVDPRSDMFYFGDLS